MDELLTSIESCIEQTLAIKDAGDDAYFRQAIYKLLQAQKGVINKELQCAFHLGLIGEDDYGPPVTINCGHNYCKNCITDVIDHAITHGKIPSCPECRVRTIIPEGGFKANVALTAIVCRLIPQKKASTSASSSASAASSSP